MWLTLLQKGIKSLKKTDLHLLRHWQYKQDDKHMLVKKNWKSDNFFNVTNCESIQKLWMNNDIWGKLLQEQSLQCVLSLFLMLNETQTSESNSSGNQSSLFHHQTIAIFAPIFQTPTDAIRNTRWRRSILSSQISWSPV